MVMDFRVTVAVGNGVYYQSSKAWDSVSIGDTTPLFNFGGLDNETTLLLIPVESERTRKHLMQVWRRLVGIIEVIRMSSNRTNLAIYCGQGRLKQFGCQRMGKIMTRAALRPTAKSQRKHHCV